jgi:tetratricopeptide (TPR) repeat protein
MTAPQNPLHDLLRACVVRIDADGTFSGTGFFVAPRRVLTCAHVTVTNGKLVDELTLYWQGQHGTATVIARAPKLQEGDRATSFWPYPDAALLEVSDADTAFEGHPCVLLDEGEPQEGRMPDHFYVVGHTKGEHANGTISATPVTLEYEGPLVESGARYLKLKHGDVLGGMSGGPILNLRTGGVCALVESRRNLGATGGGFGVPVAEVVRRTWPSLIDDAETFHAVDLRWRDALTQLAHATSSYETTSSCTVGLSRAAISEHVADYRLWLEEIAPDDLLDRREELALLTAFCDTRDPYLWLEAQPWAGKTALLAWFALHPPEHIDVVYFFTRAVEASESDHFAFTRRVLPQLAALTGDPLPTNWEGSASDDLRRRLLTKAAEQAQQRGRRLLLIVDGLDEDRGTTSIAAKLPRKPHPNLRVLLASRDSAAVTNLLDADHPLRRLIRKAVTPSEHAHDLRVRAEQEVDALLEAGRWSRDVIGFIAAVEGGLSTRDLAELTKRPYEDVKDVLQRQAARSLTAHAVTLAMAVADEPRYVLAHEVLLQQASTRLGDQFPNYYRRIHAWAERYAQQDWPETSPAYLLLDYSQTLRSVGDVERLRRLASDAARHDRLLDATGGDSAAIAEIGSSLRLMAQQPQPDVVDMCLLARTRDDLEARNANVPGELLEAWVRHGRISRATAVAEASGTISALVTLVRALAKHGDVDKAVEFAARRWTPHARVASLASVACVLAEHGTDDRYADLADSALQTATSITDREARVTSLSNLAESFHAVGDRKRCSAAADHAIDAALAMAVDNERRGSVLVSAAKMLVKIDDRDRFARLAASFTDEAPALPEYELGEIVEALGRLHLRDPAIALVGAIADESDRASRMASLAATLATAGDCEGAVQAARVVSDTTVRKSIRDSCLGEIAIAIARNGDAESAQQVAGMTSEGKDRAYFLANIAVALAESGKPSDAQTVIRAISSQSARNVAHGCLAIISAAAGHFERAETDLAAITPLDRDQPFSARWEEIGVRVEFEGAKADDTPVNRYLDHLTEPENEAFWRVATEMAGRGDVKSAGDLIGRVADDYGQARALATVAGSVADSGDASTCRQMVEAAVDLTAQILVAAERAVVLAIAAVALSRAGDSDRSHELADLAIGLGPRDRMGDADLAAELATNLARAGHIAHAVRAVEAVRYDFSRDRAFSSLGSALLGLGYLTEAQELADRIKNAYIRDDTLTEVAKACAVVNPDQAERAAEGIASEFTRDEVLADLAESFGRQHDWDRAERMASAIGSNLHRIDAVAPLVEELAEVGDVQRAERLARMAANPVERQRLLSVIVSALASKGDIAEAEKVAIGMATKTEAKAYLAEALAAAGLTDQALAEANGIDVDSYRDSAMSCIAAALAEAGSYLRAKDIAMTVTSTWDRRSALINVAVQAASAGKLWQAGRIVRYLGEDEREIGRLYLARSLAESDRGVRAHCVTYLTDRDVGRPLALAAVALAYARSGRHLRARRIVNRLMKQIVNGGDEDHEICTAVARTLVLLNEAERAEQLVAQLRSEATRSEALTAVAITLAGAKRYERLDSIIASLSRADTRANAAAAVAVRLAENGDRSRAESFAMSIDDPQRRDRALGEVAYALARVRMVSGAREVVGNIQDPNWSARALAQISCAIAEHGDFDEAVQIAEKVDMDGPTLSAFVKPFVKATRASLALPIVARAWTSNRWYVPLTALASIDPEALERISEELA